jgi:hypothetical protein
MGSSKRFVEASRFLHSLQPVSWRINQLLKRITPKSHKCYIELKKKLEATRPWASMFAAIDPLVMQGRSVAWNRCTANHRDTRGPRGELNPMVCLSGSEDAWLVLEDIKECLYFGPGTILFIRGGEMKHAILSGRWQTQDGVRISIVHFTHRSVWEKLSVNYVWE